ncbi:MAG: hypothetical protein A2066_11690 [Bacteroidetes bacterium GWB2_41_8]|nr:MAG: hypothetical protein A2066_11690 [Bacteroidetes bacterium GWB2_41_8]
MNLQKINTIDEVISALENIILESEENNDPAGYFAALYLKVTQKVKEGISTGFFDNGPRMEQLDVVFAKRYLTALEAYRKNQPVTESWQKTFVISAQYWPIVLQHLLMGMNAHINLDLCVAAAEVSKENELANLENDFNKINEILSSLVHDVQGSLSMVWPALKYILKWTGKIDDYLVDFSMKLARDGAWKFANEFSLVSETEKVKAIITRDKRVAGKVNIILKPGLPATLALRIIRITERGTVAEKIRKMAG